MQALLEAGADPNAGDDGPGKGNRPLHDAAWRENPIFVKTLIEAGADPNVRDSFGNTPLHYAAHNANPTIAALLLDAGADPNARGQLGKTPLDEALKQNNRAVADLLLEGSGTATAKAKVRTLSFDPNERDMDGRTSLHRAAAERDSLRASRHCSKAGADPNARDKFGQNASALGPRSGVTRSRHRRCPGGRRSPPERTGRERRDPAASWQLRWNSSPEVVGALLKAGANPNARDKRKKTPLHRAVPSGQRMPGPSTCCSGPGPTRMCGIAWQPHPLAHRGLQQEPWRGRQGDRPLARGGG